MVTIAAAISGAASVIACDLDKHALDACIANSKANKVELGTLEDLERCAQKVDLLIAADLLYDRENIPWLERLGITPMVSSSLTRVFATRASSRVLKKLVISAQPPFPILTN